MGNLGAGTEVLAERMQEKAKEELLRATEPAVCRTGVAGPGKGVSALGTCTEDVAASGGTERRVSLSEGTHTEPVCPRGL